MDLFRVTNGLITGNERTRFRRNESRSDESTRSHLIYDPDSIANCIDVGAMSATSKRCRNDAALVHLLLVNK